MAQVKAVPEGHTTVTPFFNIKGASEAIALYKKAFGAEETYRQDHDGKVMICELRIGTGFVRMSDAMQDPPTQSSTHLLVDNADAWFKRALDAGCEQVRALETMFWGDRWGIVRDKFGNRWSIMQHVEDVPPAELAKRRDAAMKNMK